MNPSPTLREGGAPAAAALAGGFWGGCLYLFCSAGSTRAVDTLAPAIGLSVRDAQAGPSVWLLASLIVIPAVYVRLAARPTWAIGYKLLALALGWTFLEAVFHVQDVKLHGPLCLGNALPAGSQDGIANLHWFARLLAYVCTAFLVASVNASLVDVLSSARLSFRACMLLAEPPKVVGWLPSQVVLAIRSWTLRQAYPRAPPI